MAGLGNIFVEGPGGEGGAVLPFAGARNGTSQDTLGFVVLGQVVGDAANMGKLLNDREIPFNDFTLDLIDGLNTSAIQDHITFFTPDLPFGITQNGDGSTAVGNGGYFGYLQPVNYGVSYSSDLAPGGTIRMDRWYWSYALGDNNEGAGVGMPDAVLNLGYNMTAADGRLNDLDGSWRLGFETNFAGDVGGFALDFEFHLPEVTLFDGTIQRTQSYYVNKSTGETLAEGTFGQFSYLTTGAIQQEWARLENINEEGGRLILYTDFSGTTAGDLQFLDRNTGGISLMQGTGTQFGWTPDFTGHPHDFMFLDGSNNLWVNQDSTAGGSQPAVGVTVIGQITADLTDIESTAQLQVWSTTKGFLPPRMTTTQKLAIVSPADGLEVYDTTLGKYSFWSAVSGTWQVVTSV